MPACHYLPDGSLVNRVRPAGPARKCTCRPGRPGPPCMRCADGPQTANPCPLACQLFVLLPTHVASFPRIFLRVHYPHPDSSNPDQSSPTLLFVKAWFVNRTWRGCPAIRYAVYVYPSLGQWFVEEYWWIWVVLIPVLDGYQKNMWEVIRVSSRFSIWIFQGIRLGDTLYEMWLQGIYKIWNPDRIFSKTLSGYYNFKGQSFKFPG